MDVRSAVVPTAQIVLAACIGVLTVLGWFATDAASAGARVVGGPAFSWFVVLPMTGIVALGLFDWQMGRGPVLMRAADVAAFALAGIELSLGTTGFARWLAGAIALAAAIGLAASFLITPPRPSGWRH
jgi:hypothetical protein